MDDRLSERIEQAIAAANARGIDLKLGRRPAPEYENYKEHRDPPRPRVEGKLRMPGVLTGHGRQTYTPVVHVSSQEAAYIEAQMNPLELAAILWCWNGDKQAEGQLKFALLELATELKESGGWPSTMKRGACPLTGMQRSEHYLEDLCQLALLQGAYPWQFSTVATLARLFGISEQYWRRSFVSRGYHSIWATLENWHLNGKAMFGRLLTSPAGEPAARRRHARRRA